MQLPKAKIIRIVHLENQKKFYIQDIVGKFDVVSGLIPVKGRSSYLTMVDQFSGFVIAKALRKETSLEIAEVIEESIIKVFGPPRRMTSDNAANLQGPPIRELFKFYNIQHKPTVAYSPTSHALVENVNKILTNLLRTFSLQFDMKQQAARVSEYTGLFWLGELVEFSPTDLIFTRPKQELTEAYITGKMG